MQDDPTFVAAVDQAEATAEVAMCRTISEASKRDWRAAAWLLERRYPADYGRGRARLDARSAGVETRRMAEFFAAELGLDAADVIAEAEKIAAKYEQHRRQEPR